MNPAREFQSLIGRFCQGLDCLQSYCAGGPAHVTIEDDDLIFVRTDQPVAFEDASELRKLGWESYVDLSSPVDGVQWSFRLMIPTTPCADRLNSEREVAELHAQY